MKGFHELGGGCAGEFPGARLSGRAAGSSGSQTPLWTPSPGAQCVVTPSRAPSQEKLSPGFPIRPLLYGLFNGFLVHCWPHVPSVLQLTSAPGVMVQIFMS